MFGLVIAFSPGVNLAAREIGEQATKVIVGWNFPSAPGIQIFSVPRKNKYYHVLTDTGETLYVAKVLEKLEDDLCLGDKQKHWYLLPDDGSVSLDRASSLVIVIESNVKNQAKGRCGQATRSRSGTAVELCRRHRQSRKVDKYCSRYSKRWLPESHTANGRHFDEQGS